MLFALMALAAAASTPAYPDPLAPAASGRMECYAPTDHKTCSSMSAYTANGDGSFSDAGTVMLSKDPLIILRSATPVAIKSGSVCGEISEKDILSGSLTENGSAMPADKQTQALQTIVGLVRNLIGHEICTTYVPDGTGFIAKASMDGQPQPAQDQKMIWVSPADGYTVAP